MPLQVPSDAPFGERSQCNNCFFHGSIPGDNDTQRDRSTALGFNFFGRWTIGGRFPTSRLRRADGLNGTNVSLRATRHGFCPKCRRMMT